MRRASIACYLVFFFLISFQSYADQPEILSQPLVELRNQVPGVVYDRYNHVFRDGKLYYRLVKNLSTGMKLIRWGIYEPRVEVREEWAARDQFIIEKELFPVPVSFQGLMPPLQQNYDVHFLISAPHSPDSDEEFFDYLLLDNRIRWEKMKNLVRNKIGTPFERSDLNIRIQNRSRDEARDELRPIIEELPNSIREDQDPGTNRPPTPFPFEELSNRNWDAQRVRFR